MTWAARTSTVAKDRLLPLIPTDSDWSDLIFELFQESPFPNLCRASYYVTPGQVAITPALLQRILLALLPSHTTKLFPYWLVIWSFEFVLNFLRCALVPLPTPATADFGLMRPG